MEAVHLLIGFVAALTGEDLGIFQCRCIDGGEAVGAKYLSGRIDHLLARYGEGGWKIAEAFKRTRLDQVFFIRHKFTS